MKASPVLSRPGRERRVAAAHPHRPALRRGDVATSSSGDLGLPEPDVNLGVGSGTQATQTAALMVALEPVFLDLQPALIVVYGDVNSTLAAALVAAKLGIPVAHVEAGLRSFDDSMPEEINRRLTDQLGALLFVTSPEGVTNLQAEGVAPTRIHLVGNPMIDTLVANLDRFDAAAAAAAWTSPTGTSSRPSTARPTSTIPGRRRGSRRC